MYLLPCQGGEAGEESHLSEGITENSWGEDSREFLAHGAGKPADDQNVPDTSTTSLVYTRLDEQFDGLGYKHGRHQQLWLISLDDGTTTRLTSELVDLVESCWSPDGAEIAFCANRRPDPDLSTTMALWVLTLATDQMRRLTPAER